MESMSHSSRIDFCRCRQLYYYRKILGIQVKRPMLPEAMKLGLVWDKFIISIYKGENFKDRFWHIVDVFDLSDYGVAKLYALIKAFMTIDIKIDRDGFINCQDPFEYINGDIVVTGLIDRAYETHLVETKLTTRPDFYHRIHAITSQVSTYLLSNEKYEYAIIEAVRVPTLRTGFGKFSGENSESYKNRIFGDIIARPSHYFPGFNRSSKNFGKKFWRSEFPLEEIKRDYQLITTDIKRAVEENAFWQNFLSCYVPSQCLYLPICETGVVSELIYDQKANEEGGEQNAHYK